MSILNYTSISKLLAKNKGSIRENKYPTKYKKQIELIKRWEQYLLNELKLLSEEESEGK
jgi:hypothetical protein